MILALAGNQNCGKTTLFNQLTGSNQHVGNFPGVTVEQKIGQVRGQKGCSVVDLPGIYSLRPYTAEEIVTRDFILNQKPDGIINIVDATNLERNLYLTLQLLTLRVPTVLALNMMDELTGNGGSIDVQKMAQTLGVPVVPICAATADGVSELIDEAVRVAEGKILPQVYDFCEPGPVHRCIHAVCHQIEDHAQAAGINTRFAATWLIEGDSGIEDALKLDQNEKELIEHSVLQMEQERGLDRNAALADMRYSFIEKLVREAVVKPRESRQHRRSVQADKILTGKYTAIPIFIGVMFLIFFLTFHVIGAFLSDLLALGIDKLTALTDAALTAYGLNPVVQSLIIDGIFEGVGSVLSFLPVIVTLFFFLSILEDTGYMARVAFVMDKLLRRIGLSGKSIVPMLIGFGPRRHGHPDTPVGARPDHDDSSHALYELLGKNPDLRLFLGGVFPAARGACDDCALCVRYSHGNFGCAGVGKNGVPRPARAVCDGASQLPAAVGQERGPSSLGKSEGLFGAGVYGHFPRHDCHLVLAEL